MNKRAHRTPTLDYEVRRPKVSSPPDPRIVALIFGLPVFAILLGVLVLFLWFAMNFWSGMRLN
jgi:hypothetical protein